MITDFSHVTISCADLDRSIAFYQSLGLVVTNRVGEVSSDGVARAFALPAGHLDVVHLGTPDGSGMVIDLVRWINPAPAGTPYPALNYLGLTRLAFRVDDIDATVANLRAHGVTSWLSHNVQEFGRGVRSIALTDPDGTILQLITDLRHLPPA